MSGGYHPWSKFNAHRWSNLNARRQKEGHCARCGVDFAQVEQGWALPEGKAGCGCGIGSHDRVLLVVNTHHTVRTNDRRQTEIRANHQHMLPPADERHTVEAKEYKTNRRDLA